jgi:ABC-type lipoprotein release transport system permease subunit
MMYFLTGVIVFGVIVLLIVAKVGRKFQKGLNKQYFDRQWQTLLARVKNGYDGMILAVIDADKLLDEALKKKGYKGKTMGERMVSAQRTFSNNDGVWYAHKLRNRLVHEPNVRLKKNEAKSALAGVRQGLKDLGAL